MKIEFGPDWMRELSTPLFIPIFVIHIGVVAIYLIKTKILQKLMLCLHINYYLYSNLI
jgi:hypothetical protein